MAREPYASREDMKIRFGEETLAQLCPPDLPDPGAAEGEPEPSLDAALSDASDLIDSYAAVRYAVPLSPVPAPVVRWCCDIARYYLDRARTDEAIRKAYEDALKGLADMSKGLLVFQCEGKESKNTAAGQVHMSGPRRVFSMRSMRGY